MFQKENKERKSRQQHNIVDSFILGFARLFSFARKFYFLHVYSTKIGISRAKLLF